MERSKIQCLYDACTRVFSDREPPTFQKIQWLRNFLDRIEAIDVGIDEFNSEGSPRSWIDPSSPNARKELICGLTVTEITYIHIYQSDDFSIGVFCFPAGGKLPLHDHPGMTVLSKVLYGSVHVKSYDWVKARTASSRMVGLASTVTDGVIKAPREASVLFPKSGGNIHSFTALTPCAILDVLSPPYSDEFGRPSTYFSEIPIPSLPGYVILKEIDLPNDLVVTGAQYVGPQLDTGVDLS
ncbi:PREDICTED: plant cysteine oxidase 1-like isoform X2 [Nelumbo nucifera]|uniref:cysteine dioxygenase n=1 Tax=Nelumbo nucifera TaxID=4432 RepID=A0A1U8BA78_NELNU|nr:PREDICTED: plant cysteine oxidase 1-like isoform X2 [Nelumbo nucifera]